MGMAMVLFPVGYFLLTLSIRIINIGIRIREKQSPE